MRIPLLGKAALLPLCLAVACGGGDENPPPNTAKNVAPPPPATMTATATASAAPTVTAPQPDAPKPPDAQPQEDAETAVDMSGDSAAKLRAAVARASRPAKERARDAFRHPVETLEFFGIKDDENVVEISAGTGWYTAILAPYLRDKGHLSITLADPNGPPERESTKNALRLVERFKHAPSIFDKVELKTVTKIEKPEDVVLGADGSADLVLTFRNLHGWLDDKDNAKLKVVLASVKKVLKKGGIFGVVDHRAKANADPKKVFKTGYVPEAYAVRLITAAGFKLVGKSEINANPKDSKDWKNGVWQLPPSLDMSNKADHPGPNGPDLTDADKQKMNDVGESDRFTLKFQKI